MTRTPPLAPQPHDGSGTGAPHTLSVGFVGVGGQGLPMAVVVADALVNLLPRTAARDPTEGACS